MQIVSTEDNLHITSKPIFWEKQEKNLSKCCLLKCLPLRKHAYSNTLRILPPKK